MPEFILDHGTPESAKQFAALDSFTQGYIEAMFFTSEGVDNDCDPGHENDLADISVADLAPETMVQIIAGCSAFQLANATWLAQAYDTCICGNGYDEQRAGNDFWYSRNGHGTGFWDRDLGETGDELHNVAKHSEINLYLGDDGLLYLA